MEQFYDMHCHVGFAPAPAALAAAGAQAGIAALSCTVTPAEYERLHSGLSSVPNVAVALGVHPWWIADGRVGDAELNRFCELAASARFIGEIGLDFAGPRDTAESRARQVAALERILDTCNTSPAVPAYQGDAANGKATSSGVADGDDTDASDAESEGTASKLISIHAANAAGTVLDLLQEANTLARHRVILHWFSGTSDDLNRAVAAGCYFSVGPRMLASRRGREYARQIPLDRLLLETDMPSREGETLPANIWRAELGNALAGIAQLKNIDRDLLTEHLATTSSALLGIPAI